MIGTGQQSINIPEQCSAYSWTASYTRELLVVHSLYHSIFYVVRSRDFSAAIGRVIPDWKTKENKSLLTYQLHFSVYVFYMYIMLYFYYSDVLDIGIYIFEEDI